ncbi:hypothetical protein GmHk_16G046753 [Glycine max]|nr:hypothetical protein GmHk_16G046753 [Glycine max]
MCFGLVLSKQRKEKDLWKCLTNFSFSRKHFRRIQHYNKYVFELDAFGVTMSKLLNMTPAFLEFLVSCADFALKLPKFLSSPKLKSLHLKSWSCTLFLSFNASNNYCVDPFSTCNSLDSLVLINYSLLDNDPKVLCTSDANLSCLMLEERVRDHTHRYTYQPKIVFSTPHLISITIIDNLIYTYHQLSSIYHLSFLELITNLFSIKSNSGWEKEKSSDVVGLVETRIKIQWKTIELFFITVVEKIEASLSAIK